MTMKTTLAVLILLVALSAQTTTPVFGPPTIGTSGPIATSPSQCPVSGAHGALMCPVETGASTGTWYCSVNGSPLAPCAPPLAGVQTVNGHAPDAKGNVQLTANSTTTTTIP